MFCTKFFFPFLWPMGYHVLRVVINVQSVFDNDIKGFFMRLTLKKTLDKILFFFFKKTKISPNNFLQRVASEISAKEG